MPIGSRLAQVLKSGPRTIAEIAEELGAKVNSVVQAASRNQAITKVTGGDGVTRLALVERKLAAGLSS
jgi:hypothetical protein